MLTLLYRFANFRTTFAVLKQTDHVNISYKNCAAKYLHLSDRQETQLSPTNRATHLCKRCGWLAAKSTPVPVCVLTCQIWSFCVKGGRHEVGTGTPPPKIGQPWNTGLYWDGRLTPRYTPLPTCVTTSHLVVLRQMMYIKVDKTHSAVWIQYMNVTDRQTTGDIKDHAYTHSVAR